MINNIALFIPSFEPGGAERTMVALANGFADRGVDVDLVAVSSRGPFRAEIDPRVNLIDLGAHRMAGSFLPLLAYLRRSRPTILFSALSHANIVAILASRLAHFPIRVVVSERTSYVSNRQNSRGIKQKILRSLMRITYPWASAVTVVSKEGAAELVRELHLAPERVTYLPNPVVSSVMRKQSLEEPQHPWFRAADLPIVLAAGRLSREKGFDSLLKAFAQVTRERQARLIILGEGPSRADLESMVEDLGLGSYVSLPGFVANPYCYMRRAALFVLSSRFEGMPGVLIQAMACGCPVVSTDCQTGPREVLEGGLWGRLVPVDDEGALAKAITSTLASSKRPAVSKRAASFEVDLAVAEHLALFSRIAAN